MSREVSGICERLGTTEAFWRQRLKALFRKRRLLGNYFATDIGRLSEIAARRHLHHVDNAVPLMQVGVCRTILHSV